MKPVKYKKQNVIELEKNEISKSKQSKIHDKHKLTGFCCRGDVVFTPVTQKKMDDVSTLHFIV